jgi:hypothetical protein
MGFKSISMGNMMNRILDLGFQMMRRPQVIPRSCHESTGWAVNPFFGLAAKMGANQHGHGHVTDVATF